MYQVDSGKCLEKLFIENISSFIQVTVNRLILNSNNQLILIGVLKEATQTLKWLDISLFSNSFVFHYFFQLCGHAVKKMFTVRKFRMDFLLR